MHNRNPPIQNRELGPKRANIIMQENEILMGCEKNKLKKCPDSLHYQFN